MKREWRKWSMDEEGNPTLLDALPTEEEITNCLAGWSDWEHGQGFLEYAPDGNSIIVVCPIGSNGEPDFDVGEELAASASEEAV